MHSQDPQETTCVVLAAAGLPVPAGLDGVNLLPDIADGTSPAATLIGEPGSSSR